MITRRSVCLSLATAAGLVSTLPAHRVLAGAPDGGFAFTFDGFDGNPLPLSRFSGRVMMVVNTASECGYTGQYAGLEKLWQEMGPRGLTVVGVPSNDFGGQEPLKGEEIKNFCTLNYGVTFPLADRTRVIGGDAHPFYKWARDTAGNAAVPRWNFHKILIGPDGKVAATFASAVVPESSEIRATIAKLIPAG